MTARAALEHLLVTARAWHSALPEVSDFCNWPGDLTFRARAPAPLPVITHLTANPGAASSGSQPLRDAIVAAAPFVSWRLTYTEDEVGTDFLSRFGWFELAGPDGHFLTDQVRMTIGYWGPHLTYDRHQHEPEELYSVVSGSALFMVDAQQSRTLGPGQTRLHLSNQPHALQTTDQPILTFVFWRGLCLADDPRMSPS